MDDEERLRALTEACAAYFGCEPEEVRGFALCCERVENDELKLGSVWAGLPHWHLLGCVDELKHHLEQARARAAMESLISD
jgi:hypothetical protein